MKKKQIIVIGAVGLASFAGTFLLGWLTRPAPEPAAPASSSTAAQASAASAGRSADETLQGIAATASQTGSLSEDDKQRAMTEKQLKALIADIREKIQQYNQKLDDLTTREQRLRIAQEVLSKDIENLNNLQVELAAAVAAVKTERDKLERSKIEVSQTEKTNLTAISQTYDKMDAAAASTILANMCKGQLQQETPAGLGGMEDAVKILHYMTDRTKAKVLAEMVATEPTLAAWLCQRLKEVTETR